MRTDLARPMSDNDASAKQRIEWVDYAKGFCIIFVVMMAAAASLTITVTVTITAIRSVVLFF